MKGIKNAIDKSSFSKSTLGGIIRKGFIGINDLDKTKLLDYTKSVINQVVDNNKIDNKSVLLFIRDKNFCFLLDNKNKVIYRAVDCNVSGYYDYFISKNPDYKSVDIEKAHPDNIRARGLSVDKIASNNNFTF